MIHFGTTTRAGRAVLAGVAVLAAVFAAGDAFANDVSFKDHVMPVLEENCLECHLPGQDGYEKSGLNMGSYEGLMKGTKFGRIIEPGNATLSNLVRLIEGLASPEVRMPHNLPMIDKSKRNIIRRWINQGAKNN